MIYNKIRAFSLIELLVTIVIVGVLATISIASFNNYQEKARLAKIQAENDQLKKEFIAKYTLGDINNINIAKLDLSKWQNQSLSSTRAVLQKGNSTAGFPYYKVEALSSFSQIYSDLTVNNGEAYSFIYLVKTNPDNGSGKLFFKFQGDGQVHPTDQYIFSSNEFTGLHKDNARSILVNDRWYLIVYENIKYPINSLHIYQSETGSPYGGVSGKSYFISYVYGQVGDKITF